GQSSSHDMLAAIHTPSLLSLSPPSYPHYTHADSYHPTKVMYKTITISKRAPGAMYPINRSSPILILIFKGVKNQCRDAPKKAFISKNHAHNKSCNIVQNKPGEANVEDEKERAVLSTRILPRFHPAVRVAATRLGRDGELAARAVDQLVDAEGDGG
ncbi:hypothetical protein V8C34DRAFT_277512, partial [Trichoderma compactum]